LPAGSLRGRPLRDRGALGLLRDALDHRESGSAASTALHRTKRRLESLLSLGEKSDRNATAAMLEHVQNPQQRTPSNTKWLLARRTAPRSVKPFQTKSRAFPQTDRQRDEDEFANDMRTIVVFRQRTIMNLKISSIIVILASCAGVAVALVGKMLGLDPVIAGATAGTAGSTVGVIIALQKGTKEK
jgi:hypothetical protein